MRIKKFIGKHFFGLIIVVLTIFTYFVPDPLPFVDEIVGSIWSLKKLKEMSKDLKVLELKW